MGNRSSVDLQTQDLRAPRRNGAAEIRFDVSDADRPPSYGEIARGAVPLPDSSYRPTQAEEALASELTGLRIVTAGADDGAPGEDAVREALAGSPHVDTSDLRIVIHGATLAIEGSVASVRDRDELIAALGRVPEVGDVVATTLRIRGV